MPQRLVWDDAYSVGHDLIDRQHRHLFLTIQRYTADLQQEDLHSEAVSGALDEIRRYAEEHLVAEERLLREHRYPGLEAHYALHMQYRRRFAALCQEVLARQQQAPRHILEFLVEWWTFHVRMEDRVWARDLGFLRNGTTR